MVISRAMVFIDPKIADERYAMKKSILILSACLSACAALPGPAVATELIFAFINPSFGGNPFMGAVLLDLANAQNDTESQDPALLTDDPLADFSANLQRSILNRLSQDISDRIIGTDLVFGEGGLEPGRFEVGNFIIDVTSNLNGVNVRIFDNTTGGETSVEVPFF